VPARRPGCGFESHTLRTRTPGQAVVSGINHAACHGFLPPVRRCTPSAAVAAWQETVAKVTVWAYCCRMTESHYPASLIAEAIDILDSSEGDRQFPSPEVQAAVGGILDIAAEWVEADGIDSVPEPIQQLALAIVQAAL
jgi:hypothetical protein